jgi:ABC-type antimicrobial peptide transport system permease subunit
MVAQQTREIGIRMALGAERVSIVRMVMGRSLGPVIAGLGLGLAATAMTGRVLSSLFFGVTASDGVTLLVTCLLLVGAAIGAGAWPTRAAALRDE